MRKMENYRFVFTVFTMQLKPTTNTSLYPETEASFWINGKQLNTGGLDQCNQ